MRYFLHFEDGGCGMSLLEMINDARDRENPATWSDADRLFISAARSRSTQP